MAKKKIIIWALIIIALGAGIFFGLKKINSARKITVAPSIADMSTNTDNQSSDLQSAPQAADITPTGNDANVSTANTTVASKPVSTSSPDSAASKPVAGIVSRLASWGFQPASGRSIEAIIIHSSYDATGSDPYSVAGVIAEWKAAGVSPHYLIDRSGTIYQLVADQNIAYHAGVAKLPDGTTDVNGVSIGIEMINTMTGTFTDAQYAALNRLIGDLKKKYPITYILGHYQISPGRKTDPWNIDWSKVQK